MWQKSAKSLHRNEVIKGLKTLDSCCTGGLREQYETIEVFHGLWSNKKIGLQLFKGTTTVHYIHVLSNETKG